MKEAWPAKVFFHVPIVSITFPGGTISSWDGPIGLEAAAGASESK